MKQNGNDGSTSEASGRVTVKVTFLANGLPILISVFFHWQKVLTCPWPISAPHLVFKMVTAIDAEVSGEGRYDPLQFRL